MQNAEESSAEHLSRTANSKPSRTNSFIARFRTPCPTRILWRGECSPTLDLFEEAFLTMLHHLRSRLRMHIKSAVGNRSRTQGPKLASRPNFSEIPLLQIQKLYFAESWIVLAGPAALALPKSGELSTPIMPVTFV